MDVVAVLAGAIAMAVMVVVIGIVLGMWTPSGARVRRVRDSGRLSLTLHTRSGSVRRIVIGDKPLTIGRHPASSIVLAGRLVSRVHAVLQREDDGLVIYDRDSQNGTYVDGHRIVRQTLRAGDEIGIGPYRLVVGRAATARRGQGTASPVPRIRLPGGAVGRRRRRTSDRIGRSGVPLPKNGLSDYMLTRIAHGGFAEVYKGVRRDGQQTVAVKVLRSSDPYIREKFAQEARIQILADHPHIVKALQSGRSGGSFYIIMEYCADGSLRTRLSSGRPVSLPWAILVTGQTCEALDYAHHRGVIHRDIKPENILFSQPSWAKVADFGIARLTQERTATVAGVLVGTPAYLSYEQAKGIPVDGRSDVYSLGVVVYEMVAGRVPFSGGPFEIVRQHLESAVPPPSSVNSKVPPAFDSAILRALEKDRRERFSTAGEFAHALGYRGTGTHSRARAEPKRSPGDASGLRLMVMVSGKRPVRLKLASGATVGRHELGLDDRHVSRQHFSVERHGGVWWLLLTDPRNRVLWNGRPVAGKAAIRRGDRLRVGSAEVVVEQVE